MIRLFRVFVPASIFALLISEILLVTGAFLLASYIVLPVDPGDYLLDGGLESILLVVLTILVGLYLHDLYSDIYVKSRIILIQQLCLVMGMAFLMQGLISYLDHTENHILRMPIRVMVLGSSMAMLAIFVWRNLFSSYVVHVVGRDHLLLVGDSPVLVDIARYIASHPEKGMVITGYVGDFPDKGAQLSGGKVFGPVASLREIVEATGSTWLAGITCCWWGTVPCWWTSPGISPVIRRRAW